MHLAGAPVGAPTTRCLRAPLNVRHDPIDKYVRHDSLPEGRSILVQPRHKRNDLRLKQQDPAKRSRPSPGRHTATAPGDVQQIVDPVIGALTRNDWGDVDPTP